jgi:cell division transport system permease protein
MGITLLRYFIRQAMANIFNNRVVHLIGVGTMVISFLVFDAFVLIFINLSHWTEERGRLLTMSIYFKQEPRKVVLENIERELHEFPGVTITRFISKDDALKSLRRRLGDKAGLLDGLEDNPLPTSLEITLSRDKDGASTPYKLRKRLEGIDIVDEVQYSQEWIERFQAIMQAIKIIGIVLGGLLFLAALFIITNTIKLTIYSRKDEIEILKLVGATNRFVKLPFLIEGSIQGFLGGSVALTILFLVYMIVEANVDLRMGFASLDIIFIPIPLMFVLLLMGIVAGLVGSTISLGRFFRI